MTSPAGGDVMDLWNVSGSFRPVIGPHDQEQLTALDLEGIYGCSPQFHRGPRAPTSRWGTSRGRVIGTSVERLEAQRLNVVQEAAGAQSHR